MKEIDTKQLNALFRCIPPNTIWERLSNISGYIAGESDQALLTRIIGNVLTEYTLDEQSLIIRRLQSEAAKLVERRESLSLAEIALYSVLSAAQKVLVQIAEEPRCKIDKVLPWREVYLLLGQDVFVCAFLAYEDLKNRKVRQNFTWPAILATDHVALNQMLQQGISENHQHLYGSSQTFALNWCSVMNDTESHRLIPKYFQEFYQPFVVSSSKDRMLSTRERVEYACLCRMSLFQWLKNQESPWGWLHETKPIATINQQLTYLRDLYGAKLLQLNNSTACLDYALENSLINEDPDSPVRSLAGERHLIYQCFMKFFSGEMDHRTMWGFYLYLILKSMFRSELIQVNKKVGFRNFAYYQNRKAKLLCKRSCYDNELIRMAINSPLTKDHVISLETRIAPEKTVQGNIDAVLQIDRQTMFAEIPQSQMNLDNLNRLNRSEIQKTYADKKHFFVIHFIKNPDPAPECLSDFALVSRNHSVRQELRRQEMALAMGLKKSPYLAQRIRGIDAANFEVGCPPEVFAQTFRYLRKLHIKNDLLDPYFSVPRPKEPLAATYHAGEDFLDIAGALRCIDEAINFLELKRGDRIGHALGLGVEPSGHYELKNKQIFLPKQDRLDDLVWLLYKSQELNVKLDAYVESKLRKEAELLLREIYGKVINANNWHVSLLEYYFSMQLRADNPEMYKSLDYVSPDCLLMPEKQFMISTHDIALKQYRQDPVLVGLYHYYHYGKHEKVIGNQVVRIDITEEYIRLMREMQNAFQRNIAEKGLIIECNPSSNVLIGSFMKYGHHPMFRFNNIGLDANATETQFCSQLHICVNTDDLGVFDTSLAFEYALLFHALYEERDEFGVRRYTENDILHYLDHLRRLGNQAVFPRA